MRVVIDTSSLVSYLLTRGKLMQQIIEAWRQAEFEMLSSPQTRSELSAVLNKPHIRQRSQGTPAPFMEGLEKFTTHVPGKLEIKSACRDPKDDIFLACAVEGKAEYLVSSDRDLLDLGHYGKTCILNPGQFLAVLHLARLSDEEIHVQYSRETVQKILCELPLDEGLQEKLRKVLAQEQ